jgi:hypothetical protein
MPKPTPTPFVFVTVERGCPSLGIHKSRAPLRITLKAREGYGVNVYGLGVVLGMSGSRKYVPALSVGDTFNAHDGDPTHKVTLKVIAIEGVTP